MEEEIFALDSVGQIRAHDIDKIVAIIKSLHEETETQMYQHQKFAEYCLPDILSNLEVRKEASLSLQYLMWSILNILSSSALVRKMLWRDKNITKTIAYFLNLSIEKNDLKLQKVIANFLSTMFVGSTTHFFDEVAELEIIKSLLHILQTSKYVESTFKAIVGCFGLLSDGTEPCKKQIIDLNLSDALRKMGEKHAIEDEDFGNLAILTFDDLRRVQLNRSNGRQKFLRSQIDEILFCSNPNCFEEQEDVKFKKCSRCKLAFYCSKECQVDHWKASHHKICNK